MASIAQEYSLFEIDQELDTLLDDIEEEIENRGDAPAELMERFQQFCEAHGEKADRIGRFLRMMEARVQYCRSEADRLQERARTSDRKVDPDQVYGHVLPEEPRTQKDRGQGIHAPDAEEQPGFCPFHRRDTSADALQERLTAY